MDQQSVAVPLLKFVSGSRVVFYCHFPDKLLSAGWTFNDKEVKRQGAGLLRRAYRWPVDKLEEFTTGESRQRLAFGRTDVMDCRPVRRHTFKLGVYGQSVQQSLPLFVKTTSTGGLPLCGHRAMSIHEMA